MWTPEIESMWKSRFEFMKHPDWAFHDFVTMCSEQEALQDLELAIAEIERLRETSKT